MFSTDKSSFNKKDVSDCDYKISLAGNPNVGKSTIFNELTGLRQHTGNWTGKTVEFARGCCKIKDARFCITDLPGCYSLLSFSGEEAVTRECLIQNQNDCVVIVVDCGVIERNLSFALQVLSVTKNAVLCLNLCDEAEKNGIKIDCDELSLNLGIPVVKTCATDKKGLDELKKAIYNVCSRKIKCFRVERNFEGIDILSEKNYKQNIEKLSQIGNKISSDCVKYEKSELNACTRKLDKILTSKTTGIPIMLAMLGILFWITVVGANYPSEWLSNLFGFIKEKLYILFDFLHAPDVVTGLLIDGVYTTLSWVVSVMLPPMAIFFPLFSLVEDSGYLPRIAFNLDRYFSKCGAHGKQSLAMAMGLGCNACEYNGKNQKEDTAQTYDYYDFVKIADSGVNAENIIYRFKYNEFNNEPADKFADSKADDAGWEVFLDYQNYPTDIFGNIIDNKKLDYKDTQSVTSQGNYLSIISDGYQNNYIGKYATAWSIYNKDGDRVATIPSSALLYALGKSDEQIKKSIDSASTPADFLPGKTDRDTYWKTFKTLYQNYKDVYARINFEAAITGGGEKGNRLDGRWYYSQNQQEITGEIKIQYANTLDDYKVGDFHEDTFANDEPS